MALIKCSECGREISDKAASCPHCGNPILQRILPTCPECGNAVHVNALTCPNCGCPLEWDNSNSTKSNKSTPKLFIIISALIVIAISVAVWWYSDKNSAEEEIPQNEIVNVTLDEELPSQPQVETFTTHNGTFVLEKAMQFCYDQGYYEATNTRFPNALPSESTFRNYFQFGHEEECPEIYRKGWQKYNEGWNAGKVHNPRYKN